LLPLGKIEKLPRHQRLRKIMKIFTEAENRLCAAYPDMVFNEQQLDFFAEIIEFLQKDELFSAAVLDGFKEAAGVLRKQISNSMESCAELRRAFNTVRHILVAETGRSPADWDFIAHGGGLDKERRQTFPGMLVYLEDIRSPFNVGAMFRTAESFGVEKIFISPLCADPVHPRAKRSAMGCVDALTWERHDLFEFIDLPLFALETGGTPLGEFVFPRTGILIAGSEELGVNPKTLAAADASLGRVSIPCYGAKGSLNVSVAFGIVMQSWAEQLSKQ